LQTRNDGTIAAASRSRRKAPTGRRVQERLKAWPAKGVAYSFNRIRRASNAFFSIAPEEISSMRAALMEDRDGVPANERAQTHDDFT
jgi:hypothetical protein